MNNFKKWDIFILTFALAISFLSAAMASEDTVDISYILPAYGTFSSDKGKWTPSWDTTTHHSSTVVFCPTLCSESYVGLRCNVDTTMTYSPARIWINSDTTSPMDISTVIRQAIQVTITFRGSPDTTYGCGTIFGKIQPEIHSAYDAGSWAIHRTPGISPDFLEAITIKGLSFDTTSPIKPVYNFAIFAVSTAWTTFTWRFIPTHQNYYKLGYIGVKYNADSYSAPPGPPVTTEVQIKQIKLEAIRFY